MSFAQSQPAAKWKQKLSALSALSTAAERTFTFEASAEQLTSIDSDWTGGGGKVALVVHADGSLGCNEDKCDTPTFGAKSNCRAEYHAAKHVLKHMKEQALSAAKREADNRKVVLGGTAQPLTQAKLFIKPPAIEPNSAASHGAEGAAASSMAHGSTPTGGRDGAMRSWLVLVDEEQYLANQQAALAVSVQLIAHAHTGAPLIAHAHTGAPLRASEIRETRAWAWAAGGAQMRQKIKGIGVLAAVHPKNFLARRGKLDIRYITWASPLGGPRPRSAS